MFNQPIAFRGQGLATKIERAQARTINRREIRLLI